MLKLLLLVSTMLQCILRLPVSRMFFAAARSVVLAPVYFYTRMGVHAYAYTRVTRTGGVDPSKLGRAMVAGLFSLALLLSVGLNLAHPTHTAAAVSSNLNFQARLENLNGSIAADGVYNIEFKIYKSLSAGQSVAGTCVGGVTDDCLYKEDYLNSATQGVTVTNGYLSVNLGSITAFPANMDWSQSLYITMNIGGTGAGAPTYDGEMSPRLALTAVPYAFQAKSATQLQVSSGANITTLAIQTPTANVTYQLLAAAAGTYSICTSSGNCLGGGGGGANTALSNLTSPTALNVDLQPGVTNAVDIGSAANGFLFRTGYFATSLQAPLLQTANTTAASTNSVNLSVTTGNATGLTSNSGNLSVDVGTATGTTGTINIGTTNASALSLGRSGITTTNNGRS